MLHYVRKGKGKGFVVDDRQNQESSSVGDGTRIHLHTVKYVNESMKNHKPPVVTGWLSCVLRVWLNRGKLRYGIRRSILYCSMSLVSQTLLFIFQYNKSVFVVWRHHSDGDRNPSLECRHQHFGVAR